MKLMMPRIEPIENRDQVPPGYEQAADTAFATFSRLPGPHAMLMHVPLLEEQVVMLGNYFRQGSVLTAAERELSIIVAAREKDSLYPWHAHSRGCRRAGVSEETIATIRDRGDPSGLPAEERDLVTFVQQLMREKRVDQAVFDALKSRHGVRWLVELTALAGYYGLLSDVANAFDVPIPADGELLPVP
jgi:4-carboxymuconolactone decarboxylase